ncbi:MAG: MFS transporter [Anaerolineae bacterium]|nr:MFS transporter [Anaerolineae bacterium]
MSQSISPRDRRRAFALNVINGAFYTLAETLMDANLVLVLFVSQLTSSNLLLGAMSALNSAGWFLPQFFVSGKVQSRPRKIEVYWAVSGIRLVAWLALAAVLWFVKQPAVLLVAFFIAFAIMKVMTGLGGIPFLEVTAKTVLSEHRGRLFAWRFFTGGLLGLGGSRIVRWALMQPLPYPGNYSTLIFIAALIAAVSFVAFSLIREPAAAARSPASLAVQLRRAHEILRTNADYRRYLLGRAFLFLGAIAFPFYTLVAQQVLGAPPKAVGDYLLLTTLTTLLVNLPWGALVDQRGKRWGLQLAALGWAVTACFAILLVLIARTGYLTRLPFPAYYLAYPIFVLRGIFNPLESVCGSSLLLAIAPEHDRTLYLGYANTLLGVVLLLSGLGGGLVDLFGLPALFAVTAGLNILAAVFLRGIKPGI